MTNEIQYCPKCGQQMEQGYFVRASGLSYVTLEKLRKFVFRDIDLVKAGFRKFLPSKAEFYTSYLCSDCKWYSVDFSKSFSWREVNDLVVSRSALSD
jgi:hypothetical protein